MTPLQPTERGALLGIARAAIEHHLGRGAAAPVLPSSGPLAERRGAFVTIRVDGELRGCIGSFRPEGTLAATVAEMAVRAASEDPRFSPLAATELGRVTVSVSALGELAPLADRRALAIGAQGVVVMRGWHRGALLPRVAVEQGWDGPTFLKHACLKAGLPADAWEDPETQVQVFEADEFGEETA